MNPHRSSIPFFSQALFLSVRTSNKFYFNRCIIPRCMNGMPNSLLSYAPRFHANLIGLNYSSSATLFRRLPIFQSATRVARLSEVGRRVRTSETYFINPVIEKANRKILSGFASFLPIHVSHCRVCVLVSKLSFCCARHVLFLSRSHTHTRYTLPKIEGLL